MNLAVIPARGGSKRIPRKNVKSFHGRPMIAWSIDAARDSGLFDRIIVTTDDEEIADIGCSLGAEVPFVRPAELADDHVGTLEVIAHAVRWAVDNGWAIDRACCIYATAPLISPRDLRSAHDRLVEEGWDYVFSAGRYSAPVQRAFIRGADGSMALLYPEHELTRSQDLPPSWHDAGQFYWGELAAWLDGRPIYGPRTSFIELPPWRIQDIDTPEDWVMAEVLFEILQRKPDGQ